MKIKDSLNRFFVRRWEVVKSYIFGWGEIGCQPYGDVIFHNVVELLTDLTNDVEWSNNDQRGYLRFAEFTVFFERDGRTALWRTYRKGYAVIGVKDDEANPRFSLLDENEYYTTDRNGFRVFHAKEEGWRCYVMQSDIYREVGKSDYELCRPFIKFLDNVLNASNTSTERMGTFVVASPETPTGYNTPVVLKDDQKKQMEKEIEKDYGSLSKQRQIMLLPRGMKFQTISMEGIDRKLTEKVKLAVLAICDRIKVPANQVAIIDANSSKTLSNGTELREGDFNKYQSFERLLNHTFVRLASEMGMNVTYSIYNKPLRQTTPNV